MREPYQMESNTEADRLKKEQQAKVRIEEKKMILKRRLKVFGMGSSH